MIHITLYFRKAPYSKGWIKHHLEFTVPFGVEAEIARLEINHFADLFRASGFEVKITEESI